MAGGGSTTKDTGAAQASAEVGDSGPTTDASTVEPIAPVSRRLALPLPLAIATLVLTYWCVDIVAPALPEVRRSLALSGTGAGLVFALFFAGRLVTNLPAAFLVDRTGPRWTAAGGGGLLLVGSLLAAVAPTETLLLPARALQGTGVALLATAGLLSTLRALPGGGAAMTAFNVSAGVGGSFGLVSGGWLTDAAGWRAIFWLSAGLGAVILAGTLVARARAAVPGPGDAAPSADRENGATSPSRWALLAALLANLLVYCNYSVWVVSLSLYATERFGADAARIGTLLLVINAVHLLAAIPAGRVIRRAGAAPALAAGFGLTTVGLALVLAAPGEGWLLGPMVLYAVGQVTANSAAGDLLLRLGGGGGRAVGLVRLTSDVGLVLGPAAVGALADAAGVGAPFPVLAALTVFGAAATWRGMARRQRP